MKTIGVVANIRKPEAADTLQRVAIKAKALGVPAREIRLTGGCTAIDSWNQMQADLYGKPVSTLENPQASLLGAAILAAHGLGIFPSIASAAKQMVKIRRTYEPDGDRADEYNAIYRRFRTVRQQCESAGLLAAGVKSRRD